MVCYLGLKSVEAITATTRDRARRAWTSADRGVSAVTGSGQDGTRGRKEWLWKEWLSEESVIEWKMMMSG